MDFELLTTGAGTALPWVGLIAPFLAAFFRRADRCLDLAERAVRVTETAEVTARGAVTFSASGTGGNDVGTTN